MSTMVQTDARPRLWFVGDLNGFFGLFTNVLLNVIVLTGLCLGVVQLPADTDLDSVRIKLAYDLYYIRNRGMGLDLRILFATLLKML